MAAALRNCRLREGVGSLNANSNLSLLHSHSVTGRASAR